MKITDKKSCFYMRDIAESELQDLFKVHNLNGGNSQRESSPFYVSAINKDKSSSETL